MRILLSLLLFILLNLNAGAAEVSPLANITIVKNLVQVKSPKSDWRTAKENEPLLPGDLLRTGKGSLAEITFASTGSRLKLKELSQITVEPQSNHVQLNFGKLFVSVVKGKGGMKIKSPVAVAAVLGTVGAIDFSPAEEAGKQYSLTSIDGSFELTDTKGNITTLQSGHQANLAVDGFKVSPADILNIIKNNADILTAAFIKNGLSPENIKINPVTGQEMLQLDTADPAKKIEIDSTTGKTGIKTDTGGEHIDNKTPESEKPDTKTDGERSDKKTSDAKKKEKPDSDGPDKRDPKKDAKTNAESANPAPATPAAPVVTPVPVPIIPAVTPKPASESTPVTVPASKSVPATQPAAAISPNVHVVNTPEIKGNVKATAVNLPTPANPLPVTGVVNVNIMTTGNPIPVTGNISVINMASTGKPIPVTGKVNIANMPDSSKAMPVEGKVNIANTQPIPVAGNISISNKNEEIPGFFKPGPYYKTILMVNGLLLKDVLIIEQKGDMIRLRGHMTTNEALVPMEGAGKTSAIGDNMSYPDRMMLYPYKNTKEKSYYERWVDTNQIIYIYNQVPHPNQQKTNTDPDWK